MVVRGESLRGGVRHHADLQSACTCTTQSAKDAPTDADYEQQRADPDAAEGHHMTGEDAEERRDGRENEVDPEPAPRIFKP